MFQIALFASLLYVSSVQGGSAKSSELDAVLEPVVYVEESAEDSHLNFTVKSIYRTGTH
jgi:hypothetical protein